MVFCQSLHITVSHTQPGLFDLVADSSIDILKICKCCEVAFRGLSDGPNVFNKIQSVVLCHLIGMDLLKPTKEHATDNEDLNNHTTLLIKCGINDYRDVKFHYKSTMSAKNDKTSIRNFRHRLTIFEGK
jgi:hypothetical protein